MNCKRIKKNLIFLAEKSLPENEEKLLLNHIKNCPACKEKYELLKTAENIISEERSAELNPYFYSTVTGKLGSAEVNHQTEYKPAWIRIANGSMLIAIIAAAVILGFSLGKNDSKYLSAKQSFNQSSNGFHTEYNVTDKKPTISIPLY
jgi:predicted anti-sigma-YlaC factor YlaD